MKKRNFKLLGMALTVALMAAALVLGVFALDAQTFVTVAQPETNVIGDISAITEIESEAELSALISAEIKPAAAIFTSDASLNILASDGSVIAPLAELPELLGYSVIPAIRVQDKDGAEAVGAWLNENFSDAFIISSDFEALEAGRAKGTLITGVLDYTGLFADKRSLTGEEITALRREVFTREALVVMLPGELCGGETVQRIYEERIGVWARISDEPDASELFGAVVSGAIGIVSDDTEGIIETGLSLEENTITRAPINSSHGAVQNDAPKNSLQGIKNAYKYGATTIEFDVYLCAPEEGEEIGVLVLNHDTTTSASWSEDGTVYKVAETPWSVLSTLKIPYDGEYYGMSTLEEVCRYFAGTDDGVRKSDVGLDIEIKNTTRSGVAELVINMLGEYGLLDQCFVGSFSTTFGAEINGFYDGMPTTVFKNPGLINDATIHSDMQKVRETALITNSFLGVSISGVNDSVTEISARAALQRGMLLGVWGTTTAKMSLYFLEGYSNLANDYVRNLGNYTKDIRIEGIEDGARVTSGDEISISAFRSSYRYEDEEVTSFELVFIEGEELVTLDGAKMTVGDTNGKVTFAVKYTHDIAAREGYYDAMSYTVYSDPITISVSNFNGAVRTEGFSIRLKDYNGLRTVFTFDENASAAFEEQGYELLEYGAVVVSEDEYVADGSAVVIDGETRALTTGGFKIPVWRDGGYVGRILGSEDGIVSYCVAIVNYKANHADNVYYTAYSIYRDTRGELVVTLKDYSNEKYRAVSLYQTTLDMYINGAINASNTDDAAVWTTLETGVVTLTADEYVKTVTDMEGKEFGDSFTFKDVPNMGNGDVTNENIRITLLNNYSTGEYVAVFRGTGDIANGNNGYSQFYHKTSRTKMSHPKLTEATNKRIRTYIFDHGVTGTKGNYSLRGACLETLVCAETVVNIGASTFYETFALTSVYRARATGEMQKNETGLVDLSFVTNLNTNNLLFKLGTGAGVTKVHLPAKFKGTTATNVTNILGTAFISESNGTTRYKITKVWCGDTPEPADGVIDLSGATGIVEVMGSSLSAMSKAYDSYILILPDSCTNIDAICRSKCISEVRQATYNKELLASLESNEYIGAAKYCDLNGVEHTDPMSVPGDVEVDDSIVFG